MSEQIICVCIKNDRISLLSIPEHFPSEYCIPVYRIQNEMTDFIHKCRFVMQIYFAMLSNQEYTKYTDYKDRSSFRRRKFPAMTLLPVTHSI